MKNIFDKNNWSEGDWEIYLNNLELLRKRHFLLKKDFSKQIGVQNAFRKDLKSKPGRGTVLTICKVFGINEKWLGMPQTEVPGIKDNEKKYDLHGDWTPRAQSRDWQILGKAHDILVSESIYSMALQHNIEAFYMALKLDKELSDTRKRIEKLEDQLNKLNLASGESHGDREESA